jgi:hypothetical protein
MPWKTTLYDYVYEKNQSFVECGAGELPDFIADESYLARERARRIAELALAQERVLLPQSGETRLRIDGVREVREAVVVDISMYKSRRFPMKGSEYTEERVEKERLTFRFFEGRWRITGVEHLDIEGRFKLGAGPAEHVKSPSLPFINSDVLNPPRETGRRKVRYNRMGTVEYANRWWNSANPAYYKMEDDCTAFASQCLFAGGAPMHYTGKRGSGWWYVGRDHQQELWSYSWAVAHALKTYVLNGTVGLHGRPVSGPQQLELGDMICYDWDGDGRFTHNTIVTAKDAAGMPLVNAHTTNSSNRYWSYRDSYAWTVNTNYVFVHIDDEMYAR